MQLTVREVARLLSVSEKQVYRWMEKEELPVHKTGGLCRFNRTELLEWATTRNIKISPEIFQLPDENGERLPALSEALRTGGIHYGIPGADKALILKEIVKKLPLTKNAERELLLGALLAREALGTTALGGGIAIPHVRNPIVASVKNPAILLCFLEKPVDFGALDGEPVRVLFTMVSPTVRVHLHLLSKLAFMLGKTKLREVLERTGKPEEIMAVVEAEEAKISRPSIGKEAASG
jgi:PTS system nitrogen regulatory IIA component